MEGKKILGCLVRGKREGKRKWKRKGEGKIWWDPLQYFPPKNGEKRERKSFFTNALK